MTQNGQLPSGSGSLSLQLRAMWLLGIGAVFAGVAMRWGYSAALLVAGGLVWGEYMLASLSLMMSASRRTDK